MQFCATIQARCVCILCIICSNVIAIPFYPYGGAIETLTNNDDNCMSLRSTTYPFYFGSTPTTLYQVSNNGHIMFNNAPCGILPSGPNVAPFNADLDSRGSIGTVYLTQSFGRSPIDCDIGFAALEWIQVTWENMGFFSGNFVNLNSFQAVVATDGVNTASCFIYSQDGPYGSLTANTNGARMTLSDAVIYYQHPDSSLAELAGIDGLVMPGFPAATLTSTTGRVGQFCYSTQQIRAMAQITVTPSNVDQGDQFLLQGNTFIPGRIYTITAEDIFGVKQIFNPVVDASGAFQVFIPTNTFAVGPLYVEARYSTMDANYAYCNTQPTTFFYFTNVNVNQPSATSTISASITPSSSRSPSISSSSSRSMSNTPSQTRTPSMSPTSTKSESVSVSLTCTKSETTTESLSRTPSITPSKSMSPSKSTTQSSSSSRTVTSSSSESRTTSRSLSRTSSTSITRSPTRSESLSASSSKSATNSITVSRTRTKSPSNSKSVSSSASLSKSKAVLPSSSVSISLSLTPFASTSKSGSKSRTSSNSLTESRTHTKSNTKTRSASTSPLPLKPSIFISRSNSKSIEFEPTTMANPSAESQTVSNFASISRALFVSATESSSLTTSDEPTLQPLSPTLSESPTAFLPTFSASIRVTSAPVASLPSPSVSQTPFFGVIASLPTIAKGAEIVLLPGNPIAVANLPAQTNPSAPRTPVFDIILVDQNGQSVQPEEIEICFINPGVGDTRELCLASYSEKVASWRCDSCVKQEEKESTSYLCGQADHLTNFAILIAGDLGSKGFCGDEGGSEVQKTIAWISLGCILFCLLFVALSIVLTKVEPIKSLLLGSEGIRATKLRNLARK